MQAIAEKIVHIKKRYSEVIVVVSAMGGKTTNTLLQLASTASINLIKGKWICYFLQVNKFQVPYSL